MFKKIEEKTDPFEYQKLPLLESCFIKNYCELGRRKYNLLRTVVRPWIQLAPNDGPNGVVAFENSITPSMEEAPNDGVFFPLREVAYHNIRATIEAFKVNLDNVGQDDVPVAEYTIGSDSSCNQTTYKNANYDGSNINFIGCRLDIILIFQILQII